MNAFTRLHWKQVLFVTQFTSTQHGYFFELIHWRKVKAIGDIFCCQRMVFCLLDIRELAFV